jgi:hypothetical protein
MLNLITQITRFVWVILRGAGRRILGGFLILFIGFALMIAASVWLPSFHKVVVPLATLLPLIAIVCLLPLSLVIVGLFAMGRKFILMTIALWLAAGSYLSLVPAWHNPRLILPLFLVALTWLFLRLAGARGWWTGIPGIVIGVITLILFLGTREKANAKLDSARQAITRGVTNLHTPSPAPPPSVAQIPPGATPPPAPPMARSLFIPPDYTGRHCMLSDSSAGDFSALNPPNFIVELVAGCFTGKFTLSKHWNKYIVDKSQNTGDWAVMWCDGREHPEKIHPSWEDFSDEEFKDCNAFYLQGKGSVLVTRVTER